MEFDGGSRVLFVDEAGVKSCEGSEEKHSSHCEEYDSEEGKADPQRIEEESTVKVSSTKYTADRQETHDSQKYDKWKEDISAYLSIVNIITKLNKKYFTTVIAWLNVGLNYWKLKESWLVLSIKELKVTLAAFWS